MFSEQNFKNLVINEKYDILMKCIPDDQMNEENLYNFPSDSNINYNAHAIKLFNMLDILSARLKFFTNVFYYLEHEECKVIVRINHLFFTKIVLILIAIIDEKF